MKRNLNLYFEDILEAIKLIRRYIENSSLEKFRRDIKLQDAVIRRLEIIGGSMKKLPEEIKNNYPSIRWDDFIASRNFFAHIYFGVNVDRVWGIIKNYLPDLESEILKIKKDLLKNEKNNFKTK